MIIGYRLWWATKDCRLLSMTPSHHIQARHDGDNMEWRKVGNVATRPELKNNCGFWAFRDFNGVLESGWRNFVEPVTFSGGDMLPFTLAIHTAKSCCGIVALYGRIVEHELGYRAELADVITLVFCDTDEFELLLPIANKLGVELSPLPTLEKRNKTTISS